jgi:hypothetical protein
VLCLLQSRHAADTFNILSQARIISSAISIFSRRYSEFATP